MVVREHRFAGNSGWHNGPKQSSTTLVFWVFTGFTPAGYVEDTVARKSDWTWIQKRKDGPENCRVCLRSANRKQRLFRYSSDAVPLQFTRQRVPITDI